MQYAAVQYFEEGQIIHTKISDVTLILLKNKCKIILPLKSPGWGIPTSLQQHRKSSLWTQTPQPICLRGKTSSK